jgi:hypothetical protein
MTVAMGTGQPNLARVDENRVQLCRCGLSLLLFRPKSVATRSGSVSMTCVCGEGNRARDEVAPGPRYT